MKMDLSELTAARILCDGLESGIKSAQHSTGVYRLMAVTRARECAREFRKIFGETRTLREVANEARRK